MSDAKLSRRYFLTSGSMAAAALVAGCQTAPPQATITRPPAAPIAPATSRFALMYGPKLDGGFQIPAVPWEKIDNRFLRQEVANNTGVGPGKVVVDTAQHYLYFTLPGGRAMRYGLGLGRAGFEWSGAGDIRRKSEWPKWHPPAEMIEREPELEKYRTTYNKETGTWDGGMEPGLLNPLGARAHYIYQGEQDTLYRLHGSPEWWSIGKSVSSGCVRLINQDVIDLYNRVPQGAEIIVR
ncbi:MAG: L,D-transpeptidase [Pseudomonadota bacterium]